MADISFEINGRKVSPSSLATHLNYFLLNAGSFAKQEDSFRLRDQNPKSLKPGYDF